MTNWKEKFGTEFLSEPNCWRRFGTITPDDMRSFISTEIIEKLIEDIPAELHTFNVWEITRMFRKKSNNN